MWQLYVPIHLGKNNKVKSTRPAFLPWYYSLYRVCSSDSAAVGGGGVGKGGASGGGGGSGGGGAREAEREWGCLD